MQLIDTHAHIDEIENYADAIARAKEAGVKAIIAVGSDIVSNQKAIEISRQYPSYIFPALGLHPWELGNLSREQIEENLAFIEEQISDKVAVGEIGLDYDKRVVKRASKDLQKEVFTRTLDIARKYQKPVSIHSRYSWKDCFDLVYATGIEKAVFHWFTGFSSVLRDIINSGYFISCTPAALYHQEHRRAIKETPSDKLFLETDCPVVYGREIKYRSQPSDILKSLEAAAELKETTIVAIAEQTTYNAEQFFMLEYK
jgi:TatD DNase family protein